MAQLIKSVRDIKDVMAQCKGPIGSVLTMGALHAGHISLIKASKAECKTTVVSIFVNPLQFSPNEDFKSYPKDLDSDLKICEENGVDYVFAPEESDICLDIDKEIILPPASFNNDLCGKTRKNYFSGVATIVKRLFDVIHPDYGYWGEKDLQQLYLIKWLVNEFKLPIVVRACLTVREVNGLACSSRNKYLTDKEKEIASNLYKSLVIARKNIKSGIFTVKRAILESLIFLSQIPEIRVEYFEARDKENLTEVDDNKRKDFYCLIAARIRNVRLIDNIEA